MAVLNYTNILLRQNQFVRNYCNFKLTKSQLSAQSSQLRRTSWQQILPLHDLRLQIYRAEHNYPNKGTSSATKFLVIRKIWKNVFGKYLLLTNIVGSGVLMVFGDVMAQEIEFRRRIPHSKRYDWQRIGRMFIVGALQGPLHHYVYNWMDKVMPVANLRNIAKKILIDELVMSPVCIFIFFYSAGFLERKTFKETNNELKDKFLFIYLIDWLLWPGAQYINFRYLETKYRVTFVNICTALYNIFMSYVKHDYHEHMN